MVACCLKGLKMSSTHLAGGLMDVSAKLLCALPIAVGNSLLITSLVDGFSGFFCDKISNNWC